MWMPADRTLVGDFGSGQALTDDQFRLLEPLIPPAKPGGRPRTTDMRKLLDGLFYLVRTGCQWRHLPPPPAFPPWRTVYGYMRAFLRDGVWESIRYHFVVLLREGGGREASPTAAIIDTQSVKTTESGGPRGWDAAKRLKGRKRHVAVDTDGLLLGILVHAADIQDADGLGDLLKRLKPLYVWLRAVFADSIYNRLAAWLACSLAGRAPIIVRRLADTTGWTSPLGLEGLLTNPGTPGGKDGGEANPTELHEGVQGAGSEAAAGRRQGAVGGGDGAWHWHRAAQPVAHRAPGGRLGRGTGRPQGGAGGNAATEARGEAARRGGGDPPQGGGFCRQGDRVTKFAFVSAERANHAVATLCRVIGASLSGFYAWLHAIPTVQSRAEAEAKLREQIGRVFAARRRVYGSPRVHAELRREGLRHSRRRVARLMREMGLSARRGRRRTPRTTDSRHNLPVAPNLLARNFTTHRPDQVWLADISYIPTDEGFLYLAAIKDMATREIVGWSMADHLRAELCIGALVMAIQRHRPSRGLVHHGDRGVQYASEPYRAVLKRHGITQSMSRRGNCLDNAPMESFFASLKTEHVHQVRFRTREEAKTAVFEYIEIFYNRQRLHSAIGYPPPAEARASMEGITMRAAA